MAESLKGVSSCFVCWLTPTSTGGDVVQSLILTQRGAVYYMYVCHLTLAAGMRQQ
jgi:hypothetical protein